MWCEAVVILVVGQLVVQVVAVVLAGVFGKGFVVGGVDR